MEDLWDVITDYESYPDFVDTVESLEVLGRRGNKVTAEYEVNMVKKITYTLEHTETKPNKMTWKMIEGELFTSNDGGWKLKSMGENKVEAEYFVDVGLPLFVPKSIIKGLVGQSLPEMLEKFEARAKARAKKGPKKGPKA